jgi:hypothetical protein
MYQKDRGSYRNKESLLAEFQHSCLGRVVIAAAILAVIAIFAIIICPSEETMHEEMNDNIRQCIEERDSLAVDWIDDAINNFGYIFTTADTTINTGAMKSFQEHNTLVYHNHLFFSTMHLHNTFQVQGMRCGIGILGIVIPTVNFNDFILKTGTMRKEYNQPIIRNTIADDDYMGETPDLGGVFEYEGD